jgi:hypothetical protein
MKPVLIRVRRDRVIRGLSPPKPTHDSQQIIRTSDIAIERYNEVRFNNLMTNDQ